MAVNLLDLLSLPTDPDTVLAFWFAAGAVHAQNATGDMTLSAESAPTEFAQLMSDCRTMFGPSWSVSIFWDAFVDIKRKGGTPYCLRSRADWHIKREGQDAAAPTGPYTLQNRADSFARANNPRPPR